MASKRRWVRNDETLTRTSGKCQINDDVWWRRLKRCIIERFESLLSLRPFREAHSSFSHLYRQMDKLESIREEDRGHSVSPKSKKVYINMLDSHSQHSEPKSSEKKAAKDGKSVNLSSPSSYTSSSPSSTSSLSSISHVYKKQTKAAQASNGSSELYISSNNGSPACAIVTNETHPQCTMFSTCRASITSSKCSRCPACQTCRIGQRPWI